MVREKLLRASAKLGNGAEPMGSSRTLQVTSILIEWPTPSNAQFRADCRRVSGIQRSGQVHHAPPQKHPMRSIGSEASSKVAKCSDG